MKSSEIVGAPRVLVGQIFQEAHGFSPLLTELRAFELEHGQDVIDKNLNADSVLGGILRVGIHEGWVLVPSIAARASPGGRVTDDAYEYIKDEILQAASAGPLDAVALCLHGCIQTESLDSAEADLLASIRGIVGPHIPIVAGFDLHGHAGGGMLDYLNFASAYKTNPHGDAGSTGERVGGVLAQILKGELHPVGTKVIVPMLTSGNDETARGPLQRLHQFASDSISADSKLLDASIFNVNPFIDGNGVGQTIVVYARDESGRESSERLSIELATEIWNARSEFRHSLPSLDQAIADADGRVVVGDFGDRVLAGAPGYSVHVVKEVLAKHAPLKVVAPVTSPDALRTCQEAGVGSTVTIVAGGNTSQQDEPLSLTGRVVATGIGQYTNRGAFMRGATLRIGKYAVFQAGAATLLITEEPLMSQDPGCFLDVGIDLTKADVIVVKSGYHFKLAFDYLGTCVPISTPGLTVFDPLTLGLVAARPIYPLDEIEFKPCSTPTFTTSKRQH